MYGVFCCCCSLVNEVCRRRRLKSVLITLFAVLLQLHFTLKVLSGVMHTQIEFQVAETGFSLFLSGLLCCCCCCCCSHHASCASLFLISFQCFSMYVRRFGAVRLCVDTFLRIFRSPSSFAVDSILSLGLGSCLPYALSQMNNIITTEAIVSLHRRKKMDWVKMNGLQCCMYTFQFTFFVSYAHSIFCSWRCFFGLLLLLWEFRSYLLHRSMVVALVFYFLTENQIAWSSLHEISKNSAFPTAKHLTRFVVHSAELVGFAFIRKVANHWLKSTISNPYICAFKVLDVHNLCHDKWFNQQWLVASESTMCEGVNALCVILGACKRLYCTATHMRRMHALSYSRQTIIKPSDKWTNAIMFGKHLLNYSIKRL